MRTYHFWRLTLERAVKTFAQSLLAILGVNGVGLLTVPWVAALSTAGMATLLSVLTSVASVPVGEQDTPNLLPARPPTAPEQDRIAVPAS